MSYRGWAPYVPVAKRREKAAREVARLKKKGMQIEPVVISGRKIARTFWGEAWCQHLESFSDYENRLPRGRTYVRNGSVCHLAIKKGRVEAIVSGSELYHIDIRIAPLAASKWNRVRKQCAGQIGSMLELLQGRFSDKVMAIVTDRDNGLFPKPGEIKLACDCPDWADMCKHIAAVLYGVGARLDEHPELLFLLRDVDQEALISAELDIDAATTGKGKRRRLEGADLAGVFGVDIDAPVAPKRRTSKKQASTKQAGKKQATKKHPGFVPTAEAVAELRQRFDMSKPEFAWLLGVSSQTVTNWENGSGRLNLRRRSLQTLTHVAGLTAEQAADRLKRRSG